MTEKERALMAVDILERTYPDAICSLVYEKPYELLIATRLSAQCTDARVNIVTEKLFDRYRSLQSIADASLSDVEAIIKPCGLYHTKAHDILKMTRILIEKYNGTLPNSLEELMQLPGVGRKTANLIMGDIFHQPAIVCDTHCIRITNRLGLIDTDDPYKAEISLRKCLPPEKSSDFCHRLVLHGRQTCKARGPLCSQCPLAVCCRYFELNH